MPPTAAPPAAIAASMSPGAAEERARNVKSDAKALAKLISDSGQNLPLQRAAADAITGLVFEEPLSSISTYQIFISVRNASMREGDKRGLALRRPLFAASAIQVVTKMLQNGCATTELASVQRASTALCVLTTDVELDSYQLVHLPIMFADTVAVCLQSIAFAVKHKDSHTCIYLLHLLGSLTYDGERNTGEEQNREITEVRSQIVKTGVGTLVLVLSSIQNADAHYLTQLLLGNLACDNLGNSMLDHSGAITASLLSMARFPADQRVQENAINFLRNMLANADSVMRILQQIKEHGGVDLLTTALPNVGVGYQNIAKSFILKHCLASTSTKVPSPSNVWRVCTVIEKKVNGDLKIHYDGYDSMYDEWIACSSPRLGQ